MSLPLNRRRALKTLFCSSVLMNLNLGASASGQAAPAGGSLDLLALGDFGSGDERQKAVARGMARYAAGIGKKPDGILLLGDNFYGAMPGGVKSERWQSGFSQMYPGKDFPGPCWAIFGNHDYHDLQHMELEKLRTSFVISGGGGARLYEADEAPRAGSTVLDVHGFTHLSFAGETMTIRHVDPNGKIVHAFTKGVKHDWKILA